MIRSEIRRFPSREDSLFRERRGEEAASYPSGKAELLCLERIVIEAAEEAARSQLELRLQREVFASFSFFAWKEEASKLELGAAFAANDSSLATTRRRFTFRPSVHSGREIRDVVRPAECAWLPPILARLEKLGEASRSPRTSLNSF